MIPQFVFKFSLVEQGVIDSLCILQATNVLFFLYFRVWWKSFIYFNIYYSCFFLCVCVIENKYIMSLFVSYIMQQNFNKLKTLVTELQPNYKICIIMNLHERKKLPQEISFLIWEFLDISKLETCDINYIIQCGSHAGHSAFSYCLDSNSTGKYYMFFLYVFFTSPVQYCFTFPIFV